MSLIGLQREMEKVAHEAEVSGARRAADRLREASQLLDQQQFDLLHFDIITHLLDSSLLRQEIEVSMRHKEEFWYLARNILVLLLLISIFLGLGLAAISYLGWWSDGRIISSILPLSIFADFALFFCWALFGVQIQRSQRRAERVAAELSVYLQNITQGFLLNITRKSPVSPRDSSDVLRLTVEQNDRALREWASTNRNAVETMLEASKRTNQDLHQRVTDTFDQMIKPMMQAFSEEVATFQQDAVTLTTRLKDMQFAEQQLAKASNDLIKILQEIKDINADHLRIEQDLSDQIDKFSHVQQDAADKTGAIVATILWTGKK